MVRLKLCCEKNEDCGVGGEGKSGNIRSSLVQLNPLIFLFHIYCLDFSSTI